MSWSVNLIGAPQKIAEALDAESQRLTGDSKAEFDEALPNIKGLLAMNSSPNELMQLSGNGHAHGAGESRYSNCRVSLQGIPGRLVS